MVVLQSGNRYLLLKRNKPPYVGIYTPIGGKLEPYEDPYSAAVRETWEETGIRPAGFRYAVSASRASAPLPACAVPLLGPPFSGR